MKPIMCLLLPIFGLFSSADAQMIGEMQYVKNKGVMLESQLFKNPRSLKPIIELKNDEELTTLFKKYRRANFYQQAVARVRDFGLFYSVLDNQIPPVVQPTPLGIGLAAAGSAELLRRPVRFALKDIVEKYNDLVLLEKLELERELSINGK